MSEAAAIKDLARHEGRSVTLRGWLYGKRSGGKVVFLLLRDGTGVCQCVVEARREAPFHEANQAGQESSLELGGEVRRDERAPGTARLARNV